MTKLYDSLGSRELARVEHILKLGGIEYTIMAGVKGSPVNEILVAEEDLVYADMLLSSRDGSVH